MIKKQTLLAVTAALLIGLPWHAAAQTLKGIVFGEEGKGKEPLIAATVIWNETGEGTITNDKGEFSLKKNEKTRTLIVSYLGYADDTITVDSQNYLEITLRPDAQQLEDIVVSARGSNLISAASIEKKEVITFGGLCKMACCNLAESFENSASVTVGYSDAVSGARQIKMLGLAGIYTQMLDENRPTMRGITAPYGLTYTPGMWLKSIQVSKGVTSVVNGYEAITGQINVEHRKPTDKEPLFVNAFLGDDLRTELNVTSALQINDKLSTVILAHGAYDPLKTDHNHDGFLDMPVRKHANIGNRWLYAADNSIQLRAGVRALYEKREGGQKDFTRADRGTLNRYGSVIENKNFNVYAKLGIPLKEEEADAAPNRSVTSNIALVTDYVYQEQNSFFGLKDYDGSQNSFFANLMYQLNVKTDHKLIAGASTTIDLYRESMIDGYTAGKDPEGKYIVCRTPYNFDRNEYTAGIFSEYTYMIQDKFDLVAGLRLDHNSYYGWMLTPRAHVKWTITDGLTLRGAAGVGYRSSNLITDNTATLATGRRLEIAPGLDRMEKGLTFGGSLTKTFRLFNHDASVSFDYFRSQFLNQVIVDQEQYSDVISVYNLDGKSFTDTYQADFSFEPTDRFMFYLTYRYNNTRIDLNRFGRVQTPLVDKFKGLINIQYATRFNKWIFDFTAQLNGQSRLPVQNGLMENAEYSPVYPMFFAQVTRKLGKTEVYLGCENIAGYKQKNPILSAGDPFSNQFNSTVVWGPIMGRKIYAGMRFTL